jgi:uncharacterized cupredoxin-like copper-binding protein
MSRRIVASALSLAATAAALPIAVTALGVGGTPVVLGSPSEFRISAPATAKPGLTTITIRNAGAFKHELEVIPTSKRADELPTRGKKAVTPDEIGEVEDVLPGTTRVLKVTLRKGHYILLCNVPGHYKGGMRRDLTVR